KKGWSVYDYSCTTGWDIAIVALNSCVRVDNVQKIGFINLETIKEVSSVVPDVRLKISV
ncbi:unnamed protein product, partial [marine sediment metagenome]